MTGAGYVLMVRTSPDTEQFLKDHPEEAERVGKLTEQNKILLDVVRASAGPYVLSAVRGGGKRECVRVWVRVWVGAREGVDSCRVLVGLVLRRQTSVAILKGYRPINRICVESSFGRSLILFRCSHPPPRRCGVQIRTNQHGRFRTQTRTNHRAITEVDMHFFRAHPPFRARMLLVLPGRLDAPVCINRCDRCPVCGHLPCR